MSSLPVLLKNPQILLIGGGAVAFQKAKVLCDNQVTFTLISQTYCSEFDGLDHDRHIKSLTAEDLRKFSIVVDATGNEDVVSLIRQEKSRRFLLVNHVDKPAMCDFYFSSLLNYGALKIAVSTDGASPTLGQVVRDKIRAVLPAEISDLATELGHQRQREAIDVRDVRKRAGKLLGEVFLIGCGPGDARFLTQQALACLQNVDLILYDHLISSEVLSQIPSGIKRYYVGKQKDRHSFRQEEINQLILEFAQQGLRVARLKSGDPYVFGRGAEEAVFLAEKEVRVQVVPGLSSAFSGPALAGIPLTARGYATNFSVVSAHLAGSRINRQWLPLLKLENHTTVVLMGLSFAEQIQNFALELGVDRTLPVAIISNAARPNQQVIVTTVEFLAAEAMHAMRPAVLVFGRVVELRERLPKLS